MITNAPQEETSPAAPKGRQVQEAQVTDPLSERERDVLLALGQGYTPKQVAGLLGIADGTTRALLARAYIKLGVHDWRSAVRQYRRICA